MFFPDISSLFWCIINGKADLVQGCEKPATMMKKKRYSFCLNFGVSLNVVLDKTFICSRKIKMQKKKIIILQNESNIYTIITNLINLNKASFYSL